MSYSASTRMISSLPILKESDVDIEQTKLALDILKKISVSMLKSKKQNNNGSCASCRHHRHTNNVHNRTNYYQHLLHKVNDGKFRALTTEIKVDQFNSTPSSMISTTIGTNILQNDDCDCNESHEMMLATSGDEAYCSQYYQNDHHKTNHLHYNNHGGFNNSTSHTISPPTLLFRSVSSPVSSTSTSDSILTYLTAEEQMTSSSSSSTADLDVGTRTYKNATFYDSTSGSASSSIALCQPHPHQQQYNEDFGGLSKTDQDDHTILIMKKECSTPISTYSTPCCTCPHEEEHGQHFNFMRQSSIVPQPTSLEYELKSQRDQLQNEKFISGCNPLYSEDDNPSSTSSSGVSSSKSNQINDTNVPSENIRSLDEYQCFLQYNYRYPESSKSGRNQIKIHHVQNLFNCFKIQEMPVWFGNKLLSALESTQSRDDFQWALHQLGGFDALLILYGRIVEISHSDHLQSQGLNLAINQLVNHSKSTDSPLPQQYHLLRYLLNSENATFGFQTYKILMAHCLNPCGQRIQDYSLLLICIMESWRILIRTKCNGSEFDDENQLKLPKSATLLEHFLTIMNTLCSGTNSQRSINMDILKDNGFVASLLSLCKGVICYVREENESNNSSNVTLTIDDGLKIATLVKSLINELMEPPDASVATTLVQYGLLPLLPNDLPPLPVKEDSFFVYPNPHFDVNYVDFDSLSVSNQELLDFDVSYADEAKEMYENNEELEASSEEDYNQGSQDEDDENNQKTKLTLQLDLKKLRHLNLNSPERRPSVQSMNLLGNSPSNEFLSIFQDSLIEGFMTILLNSLEMLPDSTFDSSFNPHLSFHILIGYCSHSHVKIKCLALKLLSRYLSRVKHSVITEFIKNRGFFLTSLYIKSSVPKIANLLVNICHGFGPVSYSLMVGLIYSPIIMTALVEWMQEDAASVAPALLSVGFLPSIIYYYKSVTKLPSQLNQLLTLVTNYVVLNPKNEPWSILFCPGIQSSSKSNVLCSKLLRDAIEALKSTNTNQLKNNEICSRLLWLIENAVHGKYGPTFERWLFKLFMYNVFDDRHINQNEEVWKYFVKKNYKKLNYLMGVFLCNIFAPYRAAHAVLDNTLYNLQQSVIRELLSAASINLHNNNNWLTKVIKCDEQIQHCFKVFTKMYFNVHSHVTKRFCRRQTYPSQLELESDQSTFSHSTEIDRTDLELETNNTISHLSDRSINLKFQNLLSNMGILSTADNSSNLTGIKKAGVIAHFKSFNILQDSKPNSAVTENNNYGVPYHELRQCLALMEKLRLQQQRKSVKSSIIQSTFKRNTVNSKLRKAGSDSTETISAVPFHISNSKPYFDSVFETVTNCALEVMDVCTKLRSRQQIEIARRLSIREVDIISRQKWWDIRQKMTHPKAPWYFSENYPTFWSLDQSEGPSRIRIRLRKEPLRLKSKFVKPEHRKQETLTQPLQYLFYSSSEEYMGYAGVQSDIKLIRACLRIVPGEELYGEIILTETSLHYIPEVCNRQCWDRIDILKSSIFQILRRRYTLEDRALEIFVGSRCFLFVFKTQTDREQFIRILLPQKNSLSKNNNHENNLSSSSAISAPTNSALLNAALTTMTAQWVKGNLSNFDYLMHLNTAAGRTNCDLMQYPVFPFVLANYSTKALDLLSPSSFRDLRKPMAIQDPTKEDHFISTYNYLKREGDSAPFNYGSHYSNSGIVLHFLVRLPPYTQHFLKYQDGSFDIPDRSFHSVETAWRLASRDSNTDFKEMIPEFFYLPEFLLNLQNFDLGVRQNGVRVDDVVLPEWANGDARLFTLINRQALESSQTRKYLSDWVDLIFGYKQTGNYAVQALNVFHPSTYEGFEIDGDGTDDLIRRARKAMVSTYGQTPKKLFGFPHPRLQLNTPLQEDSDCTPKVLDNVTGIKWGKLIGSPASENYEVISTREFHESIGLFETISRIVFWPTRTLILGDAVVGNWDASGIRIKSNILYLCIGDEITTCCGVDTTIWIGHESGKITVLKLSANLTKVVESVDLVGHYMPVKCFDLNNEFSTAFSCSGENYTIIWDMNTLTFCNVIESSEPIDFIYSSRSTGDVLLLNHKSNTVTFTTINGFVIGKIEHDEKIESVCISSLDPGRNVNLIAVGCDYGIIRFYSSWDLKFLSQTKVNLLSTLAIQRIRYSKDGRRLYCLAQTDITSLTVAIQLAPLRKSN